MKSQRRCPPSKEDNIPSSFSTSRHHKSFHHDSITTTIPISNRSYTTTNSNSPAMITSTAHTNDKKSKNDESSIHSYHHTSTYDNGYVQYDGYDVHDDEYDRYKDAKEVTNHMNGRGMYY